MAKQKLDPLAPQFDYHPCRARYTLPHAVITKGYKTFDNPEAQAPHPGVAALLAIPGISIVSLHRNQVSVLRDYERPWDELLGTMDAVIRTQFLNQEPLVIEEGDDSKS